MSWDEVTDKVVTLTQKWPERKLSLSGRAEVANAYTAAVICYRMTVVLCPVSWLNGLVRLLPRYLGMDW